MCWRLRGQWHLHRCWQFLLVLGCVNMFFLSLWSLDGRPVIFQPSEWKGKRDVHMWTRASDPNVWLKVLKNGIVESSMSFPRTLSGSGRAISYKKVFVLSFKVTIVLFLSLFLLTFIHTSQGHRYISVGKLMRPFRTRFFYSLAPTFRPSLDSEATSFVRLFPWYQGYPELLCHMLDRVLQFNVTVPCEGRWISFSVLYPFMPIDQFLAWWQGGSGRLLLFLSLSLSLTHTDDTYITSVRSSSLEYLLFSLSWLPSRTYHSFPFLFL